MCRHAVLHGCAVKRSTAGRPRVVTWVELGAEARLRADTSSRHPEFATGLQLGAAFADHVGCLPTGKLELAASLGRQLGAERRRVLELDVVDARPWVPLADDVAVARTRNDDLAGPFDIDRQGRSPCRARIHRAGRAD